MSLRASIYSENRFHVLQSLCSWKYNASFLEVRAEVESFKQIALVMSAYLQLEEPDSGLLVGVTNSAQRHSLLGKQFLNAGCAGGRYIITCSLKRMWQDFANIQELSA